MIRGFQQAAPSVAQGGNQRPNATTPTVDMSHLTEEERIMIQSVMAKAEMADIGMPLDTSMPSRTNLPSNVSQALTQQRSQQQQQQQQQLQQQMRQQQQSQNILQGNQLSGMMTQPYANQQNQYRQPQPAFQPPQTQINQFAQQQQQNLPQQDQSMYSLQQQNQNYAPTNLMGTNQGLLQQVGVSGQYPGMSMANNQTQSLQQLQNQQPQQINQAINQNKTMDPTSVKSHQLPLLGQQTQQLVNQINSQFNLGDNGGQQSGDNRQSSQANRINMTGDSNMRNFQPQQAMQSQSVNNQPQLFGQMSHSNMPNQNLIALQQQQQNQPQQQPNQSIYTQQPTQFTNQMQLQPQIVNQQLADGFQQTNHLASLPSNQCAVTPGQFSQTQQPFNPNMQLQNVINQNQMNYNQMEPINQHQVLSTRTDQSGNYPNLPFVGGAINQAAVNQRMAATNLNDYDLRRQQIAMSQQQQPMMVQYPISGQRQTNVLSQDVRQGIRFKPGTFRENRSINDYAFSDQEIYDERADHRDRGIRARDDQSLRRYDSLDTSDRLGSKLLRRNRRSRLNRLPQSNDLIQKEIPVANLRKSRQLPRVGETNKQVLGQKQAASRPIDQPIVTSDKSLRRSSVPRRHSARSIHGQANDDNISCTSDSDSDEDWESLSDLSGDTKSRAQNIAVARGSPLCLSRQSDLKGHETGKDENSLLKLSELKLSKKANQVMEQQQLLIKQSQELIKLQQVQLEQQSKVKETKSDDNTNVKQQANESVQNNDSATNDRAKDRDDFREKLTRQSSMDSRLASSEYKNIVSEQVGAENNKSFAGGNQESERADKINRAISKATSTSSIDLINIENDTNDSARQAEQRTLIKKAKQPAMIYKEHEPKNSIVAKYSRNPLISPTDTTDSDADLKSSHNRALRRRPRQRMTPTKHYRNATLRREPTGLPPSPLPVAAAIQLHQLEQQHSFGEHDSRRSAATSRNNYHLRSKSVCNSPNHQMSSRANLSLLMDNYHPSGSRTNSPDTMSDFGGQIRHKRLPEPPSNAVPLTPSMVKKMVQAQNAAATSSGKLLTSVNAQSTLITNTHSFHNPCLDKAPNENLKLAMSLRNNSRRSTFGSYGGSRPPGGAQVSFVDSKWPQQMQASRGNVRADLRGAISSDLSKFITSTYGNSILKNSKIGNVKETPELDKLIGNIDSYYNSSLRSSTPYNCSPSTLNSTTRTAAPGSRYNNWQRDPTKPTAIPARLETIDQPSYSSTSTYSPRSLTHHASDLFGTGSRIRRNSEGENGLLSRLERLPAPYNRQVNFDRRFDSASLGGTYRELLNRPSWSVSSPTRPQYSRHTQSKEYQPNSNTYRDQLLDASDNCIKRTMSHWPESYLNSLDSESRQLGLSQDNGEFKRQEEDAIKWSDRRALSSSYTGPSNSPFHRYDSYMDKNRDLTAYYPSSDVPSRYSGRIDSIRSIMKNPTSYSRDQTDLSYSSRLSNFRNSHYRSLDLD